MLYASEQFNANRPKPTVVGLGLTRRAWTDPASRAIEACVLRCCLSLAWCLNGREPGAHCRKDTFGTHNSKQELRLGSSAPFVPTRNVFALGYLAMDASLRLEYLGRPFHYPDNPYNHWADRR